MAQGIRQGTSFLVPNVCGKEWLNDGAAWIARNAILPMQALSSNPKIAFTWLNVTHLCILIIFL